MRTLILTFTALALFSLNTAAQTDTTKVLEFELEEFEDVVPEPLQEEQVYVIVENMPCAKTCDSQRGEEARRACTMNSIQKHIMGAVEYPQECYEMGIQGTVYIEFVIDQTGKVVDAKVIRGVDRLLDAEALKAVQSLPDFIPGKQRGKPVKVKHNVPVRFVVK